MKFCHGLGLRQLTEIQNAFGENTALRRIFSLMEAADCQTIIIEEEASDREYNAEYEAFYKGVFETQFKSKPTRIHFFKNCKLNMLDVANNDTDYLGYCDIRPTPKRTIAYALIDRNVFTEPTSSYLYLICCREFKVQLGEKQLAVTAFPYIQQDGQIIRCAQAALASLASYFANESTGPDFTNIAKEVPSGYRSVPSKGLTVQQIAYCLNKIGIDAAVYDYPATPASQEEAQALPDEKKHPEQIIYHYLESGMPVLIGIQAGNEMHALVVIGHTFSPNSWLSQTSTLYYAAEKTGDLYHCSTNWVERFVVQDDNLGPYTLVPSSFLQYGGCSFILVPLEPRVYFMAEAAERFVAELFSPNESDFCSILDEYLEGAQVEPSEDIAFWYSEFRNRAKAEELVLRTNLRSSKDWKNSLKHVAIAEGMWEFLDSLPLPDKIWVVEISWQDIFLHSRRFCGEMVIDPTWTGFDITIHAVHQVWLWLRLPGVVCKRTTSAEGTKIMFRALEKFSGLQKHYTNK